MGTVFLGTTAVPKIAFVSRGATAFEIFRRGVQPDEPDTGDVCGSRRRTGWSSVFAIVEVSVPLSVKSALGQNARPDSDSGLDLNEFSDWDMLSFLL